MLWAWKAREKGKIHLQKVNRMLKTSFTYAVCFLKSGFISVLVNCTRPLCVHFGCKRESGHVYV